MNITIRSARLKAGLSQKELAALVGCTQVHISSIENGQKSPSAALAKKIADVLKINPMDILFPEK